MKLATKASALAFWLGWNVLWLLPEPLVAWSFNRAADYCWRKKIRGVRQLEANLSRALGLSVFSTQIRTLSKSGMRSYMRYYYESFLLSHWNERKIAAMIQVENAEPVQKAIAAGGVVLALPHIGNWDLAGAWATKNLGPVATVAERLKPESVFKKFLAMREAIGIKVVPLSGETGVYEFLRDELNKGSLLPILNDRDVAKSGLSNEFFGVQASLPVGAALLALDTGRPLFTCATWYKGKNLVITFDEQIPVPAAASGRARLKQAQEISAVIAQRFESQIQAHPQDWHMLQPIWPDLVVE
jgi:KDO2-lipid IV(A) lauroyltransferase